MYQFNINNLIINSIQKPMKCKIYECENETQRPFHACSMTHGVQLKEAKGWINDMRHGNLTLDSFYGGVGMKRWTVGQYLHYLEV